MNVQTLRDSLAGFPPDMPVYLLQTDGDGSNQAATITPIGSIEPIESSHYGKALLISIDED